MNFVGAAGLLTDGRGHVLLLSRVGSRSWGVPTGISELGEALEDTLRREVAEETGLAVYAAELLDVISGPETFVRLPNGDEFYQVVAVYVVREFSGTPVPDGVEGTELRFFALDALPAGLGPVDRQALERLRVCLGMD